MAIRFLSVLTLVLLAGACGIFSSDDDEDDCPIGMFDPVLGCTQDPGKSITVRMTNTDDEAVHLFLFFENFPCCRLEPGASREVVDILPREAQLQFTAGRNGTMFNTRICPLTQAQFDSGTVNVSWNGNWSC